MAALDFMALQSLLKSLGFYDFVLPWLLAFAMVFGILDKAGIFGSDKGKNKGVEAIISLVFAFYVTFFTPYPGFLSNFFSSLFGGSILVLSGILVTLLIIGLFGFTPSDMFGKDALSKKLMLILAAIVALVLLLNAAGWVTGFSGFGTVNASEWLTAIIFFGLIAIVLHTVISDKGSDTGSGTRPAPHP
ncbi:MAG: hypothetical protein V1731_00065 [Candidatus Aenigmatarchaeota archaeon]